MDSLSGFCIVRQAVEADRNSFEIVVSEPPSEMDAKEERIQQLEEKVKLQEEEISQLKSRVSKQESKLKGFGITTRGGDGDNTSATKEFLKVHKTLQGLCKISVLHVGFFFVFIFIISSIIW